MSNSFTGYSHHFKRMGNVPPNYDEVIKNPKPFRIKASWLPVDLEAPILDVGCGWGHLLLSLWASGYRNLTGVELSRDQFEIARASLPPEIRLINISANDFLAENEDRFLLITLFDLIEHMNADEGLVLLQSILRALKPSGKIIVRTPNMASLVASYTRHIDITHVTGYSEWSLFQLLDMAGFSQHDVIGPGIDVGHWRWYAPWRGFDMRQRLIALLQRVLYRLIGLHPYPRSLGFNLMVQSIKR